MPFFLVGIWEEAQRQGQPLRSFSMLTINADEHPLMRRFHKPGDEKRSVVVVPPATRQDRLHPSEHAARSLLRPFNAEEFTAAAAPRPARNSDKEHLAEDDPGA